jgi:RimJ/RimL family protein N-acetyltransferase
MPPDISKSLVLSDDRVLLRPFDERDSAGTHEAVMESFEELHRWMPWCHAKYGREDADAFTATQPHAWHEGSEYCFVIVDRRTDRRLGCCGLNRFDWLNLTANLGYWVRRTACRQGVATDATKLLLRFAFEQLGLQRVEIVAAKDNLASQRVAEKVGATREGIARNRCRAAGVQQDAVVFSVIPTDHVV